MVPPGARGTVSYIAPKGEYALEDKVLELDFGDTKKVGLVHRHVCFSVAQMRQAVRQESAQAATSCALFASPCAKAAR